MTMICMVMLTIPYYNSFDNSINNYNIIKRKRYLRISTILLLSLIFALVFGLRWNVGTDNLTYLSIYINNDTEVYGREFIFKFMNDSLYKMGMHFSIYFIIFAFIQVFLLYYTLKNEAYLWVFLSISLFGGHFFYDWMNGMRQEMASCIMLFGTNYIIKKKPIKYLICIVFASGFHISALLFLVVYPVVVKGKSLVPKRGFQYFILTFSVGVTFIVGDILSKFFPILEVLQQVEGEGGYTAIYNEKTLQKFSEITNIGVMYYVFLVINSIIIFYSKDLISFFGITEKRRLTIYYNLYYWGMIFEVLLASNMILVRPFRYFRIYKLIMIAYLLYYLYKHPSTISTVFLYGIIIILLICIGVKAYTAPFNFYFEVAKVAF